MNGECVWIHVILYSLGFFTAEKVSHLHSIHAIFKSDCQEFIFRHSKWNVIFKDTKPPQLYLQEIILQYTTTNPLRLSKGLIFQINPF